MRKVFLFILLFMVGSLVANGAENILNRYSWRVNADGCKGSCVKSDTGYEVKKDADSGAIVFTTVSLIPLKGETTYKISWQLTSPEGKNFYALGYLPNKVKIRRPWPAGNRVYGNNSKITVEQTITTLPHETQLRPMLVVAGKAGNFQIHSLEITEAGTVDTAKKIVPAEKKAVKKVENILDKYSWRVNPDGCKGSCVKSDAGYEVKKDADSGAIVFTTVSLIPLKGNSTYKISWQLTSPEGKNFYALGYLPNKVKIRRPWPAGNRVYGNNSKITVEQTITTLPHETQLRPMLVVAGKAGNFQIHSLEITEAGTADTAEKTAPAEKKAAGTSENILDQFPWRVNASGSNGSCVKNASGYEVKKDSATGAIVFATGKVYPVKPDNSYLLEWTVSAPEGMMINSMTYLPRAGKVRSPWPTGKQVAATGSRITVSQLLTTEGNESKLRPMLVISGVAGTLQIEALKITFLDKKKIAELKQARIVRQLFFKKDSLKKAWTPFGSTIPVKSEHITFHGQKKSGIACPETDFDASKIKLIEVRAAFERAGYMQLDFVADDNGTKRTGYLSAVNPGGNVFRDFRFDLASNPSWRGRIKSLNLSWNAPENGLVQFSQIALREQDNIIPFAEEVVAVRKLENVFPRGKYTLKNAQDSEIIFLDRNEKPIRKIAVTRNDLSFTAPELTVRTELHNAPANASLQLTYLRPLELPPIYYRGSWIWCQNGFGPNNTTVFFEKIIDAEKLPEEAEIALTADDNFELFVNGETIGSGIHWAQCRRYNITSKMKKGRNRILVKVYNVGAWGGFIADVYAKINGKNQWFSTDGSWKMHIGETAPEKFSKSAFVLGPPPAPPWGSRSAYAYIGPKTEIELLEKQNNAFTIKVHDEVTVDTDELDFQITDANGKKQLIKGIISPSTGNWQKNSVVTVKVNFPPLNTSDTQAVIASDFLKVRSGKNSSHVSIVSNAAIHSQMAKARVIGTGSRAFFEVDGKKLSPIYHDKYNDPEKTWLIKDARSWDSKVLRFNYALESFWKADGSYDFAVLDKKLNNCALYAPDMKLMIIVKLGMPQWWCDANPDDVVRYDRDQPMRKFEDRQALGSKKWLKDAEKPFRDLLKYIKNGPHANRVIGIGLSEGWNSEWFWSYVDHYGKAARSGFSFGDYSTFRSYLREQYQTDEKLAEAWNMPGTTFENFIMPSKKQQDTSSAQCLVDPAKDRRTMDWFLFRNRALGEAIEFFGKIVKDETDNNYLVGVYYGYLVMHSSIYYRLQSVGHLEVERLARSPYVDLFWAPSNYRLRIPGKSDGTMQAAETLSNHGKMVIVEQDLRTFSENDHYQRQRTRTVELTVGAMDRAFGLLLTKGLGTHWMSMHDAWFREKVLRELIKSHQHTYMNLPPVQNLTPQEICIVSDEKSAFYTRHNTGDNLHLAAVYDTAVNYGFYAAPSSHVYVRDLIEKGFKQQPKLYIMTNLLKMDENTRTRLMERFRKEKATVLWLYAANIFTEKSGPDAKLMSDFLGVDFEKSSEYSVPQMLIGNQKISNPIPSAPWFYPVSGFDKVIGKSQEGKPMLVSWEKDGVTHYFSTLMTLPPELIREIAKKAGIHLYAESFSDPLLIGNDCIFLHAASDGRKKLLLPAGYTATAIAGPISGEFGNTPEFEAAAGRTYGFLLKKK